MRSVSVDVDQRKIVARNCRQGLPNIGGKAVRNVDHPALLDVAGQDADKELEVASRDAVARGIVVKIVAPFPIERMAVEVLDRVHPVAVQIDLVIIFRQRLGERPRRNVRERVVEEIGDRHRRHVDAGDRQVRRPNVDVFAECHDDLVDVVPRQRVGLRRRSDGHAVTHIAEVVAVQVVDECRRPRRARNLQIDDRRSRAKHRALLKDFHRCETTEPRRTTKPMRHTTSLCQIWCASRKKMATADTSSEPAYIRCNCRGIASLLKNSPNGRII